MAEKKEAKKRIRIPAVFPKYSIKNVLSIAEGIFQHGSGEPMRRLTLLDELGLNQNSSGTQIKITASGQYGITKGSYSAEYLELTDIGRKIVAPFNQRDKIKAIIEVFLSNEKFRAFHDKWKNKKRPNEKVLLDDAMAMHTFDKDTAKKFLEIFLANCNDWGLIQKISGAETFVPAEQALEKIETTPPKVDSLNSSKIPPDLPPEDIDPKRLSTISTPQIAINIQIVIPENADEKKIEQIFKNMGKYLLNRE